MRRHLIRLLTDYSPSDPDEQEYRMRMLDVAAAAHDPFSRTEYVPGHFTASAFVVHPGGDRLLLVHHARIGAWLQPGGHVDPDDRSALEAARREVEEETGLAFLEPLAPGLIDIDIHTFPEGDGQPEHLHLDLRFGFVAGEDGLDPNHEVHDARWVSPEELEALGVDRSVMRPVEKLLAPGP